MLLGYEVRTVKNLSQDVEMVGWGAGERKKSILTLYNSSREKSCDIIDAIDVSIKSLSCL